MNPNQNQNNPQLPGTTFETSTTTDAYVQDKINQIFEQTAFRTKTNEIIKEYINTVPFMKKVQEYASEEIDKRLFKNSKVVIGVIIGWIATGVIAYLVAKWTS